MERKLIVTGLAALLALALIVYAFEQQAVTVYRPTVVAVNFQNLPVSLYAVNFNYSDAQMRYTTVTLTLNNTAAPMNASISVMLYANESEACSGFWSGVLNGFQQLQVTLNWIGNYTVNDITSGYVTLKQP
ncbi:MAG: hypothetical protein ACPLVJ_00745 [Candidatus Bathyarchaeales archaeon]